MSAILACPPSYFYPRPPCGGRRWPIGLALCIRGYFYPRPPCGGRPRALWASLRMPPFLSTPSVRRATVPVLMVSLIASISIHALRAEGDLLLLPLLRQLLYFYPRPPCGGRRPLTTLRGYSPALFLSTPSVRRATSGTIKEFREKVFLSTPSVRRATRASTPVSS